MTTSLELQAIRKQYGAVQALGGVDLSVAPGSRTAIVGPSGSGKTTLLRIIAGFEAPDAGRVTLGGRQLADGPDAVPAHERGIGYVPQDGALFPHLTIEGNVGFGLPRNTPKRAERIAELMDMVALDTAMLARRPHELSGGQQQRVALARALAQRPRLMLLDEPFSALDTGLRASTRKAVAQLLGAAGITTILVTHDQAEALSFADQVAVMRGGLLVQAGRPLDLYLRPRDAAVAGFLGDSIVLPAQLAGGWADCALGRIAVNDPARQGAAQIMLRPEQLQVAEVPVETAAHGSQADGCYGAVTDTDFGGSVCVLSVRLLRQAASVGDGADSPLLVHSTGMHAPAPGAMVRITVAGQAHVFAG
ncbi:iron(III) transport system ATP-binding protein [Polaromonas sp. YR568]|uniref:ABC transporter ATP-binding protein n=1 Tax=Polaromonas sp. YR568 TaxID=1855301 RepID=UPI0008E549B5|nr:ABC transporter ATP-binding protein [Polaromonas sp. YR568]SFU95016.1 iron(III) transport system ATP-binding protein [Polaromonas sp. YR568]